MQELRQGGAGVLSMRAKHMQYFRLRLFHYQSHTLFSHLQCTASSIEENCSYIGKNVKSSRIV